MKTITIRALRQRWPAAEKTLEMEGEIVITRDGKPVAKLVRLVKQRSKRRKWDPEGHLKWLKKTWGNKVFATSDAALTRDRADRWESERG